MSKNPFVALSTLLAIIFFPSVGVAAVSEQVVLNHTMNTLGGKQINLAEKYQGKVVLLVNVASKCGFTPQYSKLQELYDKYSEQGLVIVGVPCNQFGGQEPGSADDIASFCEKNYGVTFDMLSKVKVKGDQKCDLYKDLVAASEGNKEVKWNFEKFLVDRDGKLVARYGSRTKPMGKQLVAAVEEALAAKE